MSSLGRLVAKMLSAVQTPSTASRKPVTRASTYGMGGMKRDDEDEKLGKVKTKKRAASRELLG